MADCVYFSSYSVKCDWCLCLHIWCHHNMRTSEKLKFDYFKNERAFKVKYKTFFFVSQVLSFRLIKQTGKKPFITQLIFVLPIHLFEVLWACLHMLDHNHLKCLNKVTALYPHTANHLYYSTNWGVAYSSIWSTFLRTLTELFTTA